MAIFKWNDYNVNYEIHGSGQPLFILNGIMMSTKSWHLFLKDLRNYQVILMDFIDQGQSSDAKEAYEHSVQVDCVKGLVDHLGLKKVNLMGISYGAQIALQYAIKYELENLLIFNAALYTTPWLKDIGKAWQLAGQKRDAELYYHVTIPYIYSQRFYTEKHDWMLERKSVLMDVFNQQFYDRMDRLINSSESYNIIESVGEINTRTLVVGAEHDYLTPEDLTREIADKINGSGYYVLKDCGHASMYEKPSEFIQLINEFLLNK
jgi:pimeloyl-ACP methyl ester carboxylesterase